MALPPGVRRGALLVLGLISLVDQRPLQAAPAGERADVAVMPFDRRKLDVELGDTLTDSFQIQFGKALGRPVIGQSDIATVLGVEKQKELVGCDEGSCLAEIGGALGVRYLVSGRFARVGRSWVVIVKMIDAQSAQPLLSDQETIQSEDEQALLEGVQRLATRMGEAARQRLSAASTAKGAPAAAPVAAAPSVQQGPAPSPEPVVQQTSSGGGGPLRWAWVPSLVANGLCAAGCCASGACAAPALFMAGYANATFNDANQTEEERTSAGNAFWPFLMLGGACAGLSCLHAVTALAGLPATVVLAIKGRASGADPEPPAAVPSRPTPTAPGARSSAPPAERGEEPLPPVVPLETPPEPEVAPVPPNTWDLEHGAAPIQKKSTGDEDDATKRRRGRGRGQAY